MPTKLSGKILSQIKNLEIIPSLFKEYITSTYILEDRYYKNIPKIKFRLDHEPFDITSIELGIVHEVLVQNYSFHLLKDFPAFIKSMIIA